MHERRLKGADDARLQLGNARGRAAEEAIAPYPPFPLQKVQTAVSGSDDKTKIWVETQRMRKFVPS